MDCKKFNRVNVLIELIGGATAAVRAYVIIKFIIRRVSI